MKRTAFKAARKPMSKVSPVRKVSTKKASKPTPLRKNAKGKPCAMRLPGCTHDTEQTVLCHVRRNGWGGMGSKPHDVLAFFGCANCHDKEERHHPDCTDADILRAVGETLLVQIADGVLIVAE